MGSTLKLPNIMDQRKPPVARATVYRDVVLGIILCAASVLVAASLDLNELWLEFAERHERWELDELPVGLTIFILIAIGHGLRRLRQLKATSERLASEIAEREAVEGALIRATADAIAANRAKSDFLAMMSHELRTPLNAINGFSEIMQHEVYGPAGHPKYREYAGDIHRSGTRLLAIINTILDLSKIEAGKMDLHETEFSLRDLMQDAQRELFAQASLEGIQLQAAERSCDVLVVGDHGLITQAAANLLSNAVKFTHEGGCITTEIRCYGDGRVGVSVGDTGIGMAADEIPVALSEFEQIESTLTRRYAGTGLGLPLARRIMREHGGDLEIASRPGVGTTATLVFPGARVAACRAGHPAVSCLGQRPELLEEPGPVVQPLADAAE